MYSFNVLNCNCDVIPVFNNFCQSSQKDNFIV